MNKEILKNINVLYVEDEQDVREFTSKTISTIVNSVVVAENGKEGLEKFKENPEINLILTDINMPKMGGLEMCAEIRKFNDEVPIVITSAHSDPDFLKKAIDVKVSAYAMKPIDLYHLIESMIKAVEPIFLRKELEAVNLNLANKVEEAVKKTKLILDAQDNMVVLTDLTKAIDVNKKFLEYFNVATLEEFFEKKKSVIDQCKIENGFFNASQVKDTSSWISEILKLNEIDRVVKIENTSGEDRVFVVNIDDYEHKGEHYVVSFTDITELKEKSNLLEYQATHDQLTGLFNRQKFNEIFLKEIKRDKRYDNALSVIIFDIDDFKSFNDQFGHNVGDEVLKIISEIVLKSVREHDTIVRWGGEEFLVLLPQTEIEGAVNVAEKIRTTIENYENIDIPRKITASFGVTKLQKDDDENSVIKKADEALYLAKSKGKNLVVSN
ncbi:diguanylate cyclase [Arcobacter sp. LA11]|uniref:GGDEF domain-containing response regulator n=1 Tax=Arcobacter sp. LA11 TaxID=1898176 RepID=UPI0009325BF8|nr:diguanylate cyclase [Arcobacter sp. LA11]